MEKIKQLLKQLVQYIRDLFSSPKDVTVTKPVDPTPPPTKIPTISESISQVAPEQQGSVTDKLFKISTEEAIRRAQAAERMYKEEGIPTLHNGSVLGSPGQIHLGIFKAKQTLTVQLAYTGWVDFGVYECAGTTDGASYKVELTNGSLHQAGYVGSKAGHFSILGPGTVIITPSMDSKQHIVYKLSNGPAKV